ncbi:Uncharacterised protein [Turicibacter sanguinis]|nr:Uncharacterised protein [Turicibacter sanguinis]
MSIISIDKDTFRHAITNLTKPEVVNIIQSHGINIDVKSKKEDMVKVLMGMLDKREITEELYLAIKGKAFSVDKNFYDGFFYKFDKTICDFNLDSLLNGLKQTAQDEDNRCVNIYNSTISDNLLTFTIEITRLKPIYDIEEEKSRYFKEKIDADVSIYFNIGLMYIHSKNITESKKIKTFIQKGINSKMLKNSTIKLVEPTFNLEIADMWIKSNTDQLGCNNYCGTTIHMLDMLEEFNNHRNSFSGLCLKSIYFKYDFIETSDDEESSISELKYGGDNLQKHHRIKSELREGKKITGFKFEAHHKYIDEETGDEKSSTLPIVIFYEKKYALRISINTENVSAKINILHAAYEDIKNIFMNKFNSVSIMNSEEILNYLTNEDKFESNSNFENSEDEDWTFNG